MLRHFVPSTKKIQPQERDDEALSPSCSSCAHVDVNGAGGMVCWAFRGAVTGRPIDCATLRAPGGTCGVTGRHHVPGGPEVHAGGVDGGVIAGRESARACVACRFHATDDAANPYYDGHRCQRFTTRGGTFGHCAVERSEAGRCGVDGERGFEAVADAVLKPAVV